MNAADTPKAVPKIRLNNLSIEDGNDASATPLPIRRPAPPDEARNQDGPTCLGQILRKNGIQHENPMIRQFWSPQLLQKIMTEENILEELKLCKSRFQNRFGNVDIEDLAQKIYQKHLRVFAVLVLLNKSCFITDFMKCGISDDILPLCEQRWDPDCNLYCDSDCTDLVTCCNHWEWGPADRENFAKYQHCLSPVIMDMASDRKNHGHKDLTHREVLPFMKKVVKQNGGFGIVSEAVIPGDCHKFEGVLSSIDTKNVFALKESNGTSKQRRDEDFKKEVNNLRKFNGFYHPHLVTLLMTWTVEEKNYLLFPFANCDLDTYWAEKPNPVQDTATIQWISKQILGMTEAIQKIHDPPETSLLPPSEQGYGRHGDLKPENILWFNSSMDRRGIFIIADLGSTAFNSIFSRSNISNGKVDCTPKYKPPELDLEGGKVTRSYDIWTWGCVLLELVCWVLGGQAARNKLLNGIIKESLLGSLTPKFFDIKTTQEGGFVVLVMDEVGKCIAELHKHSRCSKYFHELLDIIENEMIVCVSDTKNRITSKELLKRVKEMHRRVMDDAVDYIGTWSPETRSVKSFLPVEAALKKQMLEIVRERSLGTHNGDFQRTKSAEALSQMEFA